MAIPRCSFCNGSTEENGNGLVCRECGRPIDVSQEPERHFSSRVTEKAKPGKKERVKRENSVVKSHRVGDTRIVYLRNGKTLKIGPRPPEPPPW